MPAFSFTPEQHDICAFVCGPLHQADRGLLKVDAGAACGKTSVLVGISERLDDDDVKSLYLTFNAPMREAAKQRLRPTIETSTFHSLALRAMRASTVGRRLGSLSLKHVVELLELRDKRNIPLNNPWAYARTIQLVLNNYVQSASASLSKRHLPYSLRHDGSADIFLKDAARLYDLIRPGANNSASLPHDVYLKEWVLRGAPGLGEHDFVLLDESQDANGVILSALAYAQRVVMVGDANQQIYSFRGAMGLLEKIPGPSLPLSMSFRFGPELAEVANAILARKSSKNRVRLQGNPAKQTRIGPLPRGATHARLYRTGYELVKDALSLSDSNIPFFIAGSMVDLAERISSAQALRTGRLKEVIHPHFAGFASWDAALESLVERDDPELRHSVTLVDEFAGRIDQLVRILSASAQPHGARVWLSTIHRAKGLEFDSVLISRDFDDEIERLRSQRGSVADRDIEHNLLYVGSTRARQHIEFQSEYARSIAESI